MILIVTGIVFILLGLGNLAVGRKLADRPNASLTRGLGYVGIGIGLLTLLGGIAQVSGLVPAVPPQP